MTKYRLLNNINQEADQMSDLSKINMSDLSKIIQEATPEQIKHVVNADENIGEKVADALVEKKITNDDLNKIMNSMATGPNQVEQILAQFNEDIKSGNKTLEELKQFLITHKTEMENKIAETNVLFASVTNELRENASVQTMINFLNPLLVTATENLQQIEMMIAYIDNKGMVFE